MVGLNCIYHSYLSVLRSSVETELTFLAITFSRTRVSKI